jgi:hypothetical protein
MELTMFRKLYCVLKISLKRGRFLGKDWHREVVGGMWNEIGRLQFNYLLGQGLQPEHYFLDIGCGCLRGGIHFIDYLNKGRYYGIEKEKLLIRAGREIELKRYGLEHKDPHLLITDDFDLSSVRQDIHFHFMLAQSVFTHLTPDMIQLCLTRVTPWLRSSGILYATFFESENGLAELGQSHLLKKHEKVSARYPFGFFQEIAERVGLSVTYIGDWNHPRNQKMLAFRTLQ